MINQKLKAYLSHVQIGLSEASFSHVQPGWRDLHYVPNCNKFYFILSGEGMLQIDGKTYYPQPQQLFLMPQGVKQSYSTINANTFRKFWCHFTATIGEKNLFDFIQTPYFITIDEPSALKHLFKQLIFHHRSEQLVAPLQAKAILLQIISYFFEQVQPEQLSMAQSESMEKLQQITLYMETNLEQEISIKQLAGMINFHPNYFIKFFRNHLGLSPMNYLIQLRIQKAKQLLLNSDLSISEIAEMIGFSSVYYLSNAFKKHTGYPPSEYRQLNRPSEQ